MNKLDRFSIKWRIFSYLLIFMAIPLVIIWLFQIVFLESFYTNIKKQDIINSVDTIAENIDSEELNTLVDGLVLRNDLMVGICDSEGNMLYSTGRMPDIKLPLEQENLREYFRRAVESGGSDFKVIDLQPSPSFEGSFFEDKLPPQMRRSGQSMAYNRVVSSKYGDVMVMVNAEITPVDATVRTLQVQLVYISVIMVVLSLFIAFVMSGHISKPIIRINRSAKKLAAGEYDTVFDAHGYREIAELNSTLNYASAELSKVERLRQELIANVSHDLRTPLTMIIGYAEVMRDIPGENTPANVQSIIDEASRLSELVSDMLEISSLQTSIKEPEIVCFNLTKSVRDILKRYAKLISQNGYTIEFNAQRDVFVNADPARIAQVLYNLINNAVNYTGEDKKVIINQLESSGRVRVEVVDTGAGIPQEELAYIWDRYYRASHKRAAIGTGLGLSIVREILKMHGADYGVKSTVGEGSTFWFELGAV